MSNKRRRIAGEAPPSTAPPFAALPAVLAVLLSTLAILLVTFAMPSRATLIARYQQEADRAFFSRDILTARLCAQRLMQLDPTDPANQERLLLSNGMTH